PSGAFGTTSLVKGGTNKTAAQIEQCGEGKKSPVIREMSEGQRVYVWHPAQTTASGLYLVRARTDDYEEDCVFKIAMH
ncbi:hypothetical protein DRQ33_07310, partial [bacterium]